MRRTTAVAAVLTALLAAPGAHAQYEGAVSVSAVVVPVTVRDDAGRVVSDVPLDRFRLLVDGLEVPLAPGDVTRETDWPLSLTFVLDTSGSMDGEKRRWAETLILLFLGDASRSDQHALWTFGNGEVSHLATYDDPWFRIALALDLARPWGTTALYDMVRLVPELSEGADFPRRAIVLLTDGVDNASRLDPAEAVELSHELRTPVYIFGISPPADEEAEGVAWEETLELIADASGGRYQRVENIEAMPGVIRRFLRELSARYLISFATSGIGHDRWRTIEVEVPGYRAIHRKGYQGRLP